MPVFVNEEPREVEVEFEGNKYKFKVKDLTWAQTNQIVNMCTTYGNDNTVKFDIDKYYRESLVRMIVKSPPEVPISALTLVQLTPEFGRKLAELVPLPSGGADAAAAQFQDSNQKSA
jgi:hypothetical protein